MRTALMGWRSAAGPRVGILVAVAGVAVAAAGVGAQTEEPSRQAGAEIT